MTTTSQSTHHDTRPVDGSAPRVRLIAGALATSAVTIAALLIATPWGDRYNSGAEEILAYDSVRAVPGGAWIGMLVSSVGLAVLATSLSLTVCHLARGRGGLAALFGAVLATLGGLLSAMGGLSFGTVIWFASSVSDDAGRALVDHANDNPGHLVGATMAGFFLLTLGELALATALIRARAVPIPAVAAYVLLVLTQFAISGRALDVLQIVMMALYVTLATTVLRRPSA